MEVLIDNPVDWLENNPTIEVDGFGECETLSANKHGDVNVEVEPDDTWEINISSSDVTTLYCKCGNKFKSQDQKEIALCGTCISSWL